MAVMKRPVDQSALAKRKPQAIVVIRIPAVPLSEKPKLHPLSGRKIV